MMKRKAIMGRTFFTRKANIEGAVKALMASLHMIDCLGILANPQTKMTQGESNSLFSVMP